MQEYMRQVEFVPFRLTEAADIYSIRIEGKKMALIYTNPLII